MLIGVPFIYFSLLCAYFVIRHKRFEVSALLALLYAVSGLASIPVYLNDTIGAEYGTTLDHVGVIPTILYCGLLTLTFLPFHFMHSEKIVKIEEPKPWLFNILSWLFIFTMICTVIDFFADIKDVLTGGALKAVRDVVYHEQVETQLTGWQYYMALPETLFSALAMLAIPFFFYSICFLKRGVIFNVLLLLASTTSVIKAITIAGRTQIIYWVFIFAACYLFFAQFMKVKHKIAIQIVFGVIGGLIIFFFVAVTLSRYNEMADVIMEMVTMYVGQPFVEFCYFWDHFHTDFISFQRLFPFTHQFILHVDMDLEVYRSKVYAQSGLFIGVFFTFLGDLLIDIGRIGMMIYVFFYHIVVRLFLRRKQEDTMPFYQILIWFICMLVPLEGLFYYSFHTVRMGYYVIETIILAALFRYNIRLWYKNGDNPESIEDSL